jgi:hypothetical protein
MRSAVSDSLDADIAAAELAEQLSGAAIECLIFFCSPQYDLHSLGKALAREFDGMKLLGCTTAEEISRRGVNANAISAVAMEGLDFAAEVLLLDDLAFTDEASVTELIDAGLRNLEQRAIAPLADNTFAFSLLDGLSIREEIMLPVMHGALGGIPLFGGSAGDAMEFSGTYIYHDGAFHENAAVLAIINTRCPFHLISSHHFAATAEKLVVTKADPERRVVLELNAEPAAPEYCRVMGLSLDDLSPPMFASHPLGVQLGEHLFTRSIRQLNDDLSLTFFCAIDNGIILTKLEDTGMLEHFTSEMSTASERIGDVQLVIGCDCIHRFHEADVKEQLDALSLLYRRFNVVGFNTYGEQRNGLHVNHSFTGIAIGFAP